MRLNHVAPVDRCPMAFTLDSVRPWGRSFEEYVRMFDLSDADLSGRILGCADGPASFNCELTQRGGRVVSCDPLYNFSQGEIRSRLEATFEEMMAQLRQNLRQFVWTHFRTAEEVGRRRMAAMDRFLEDFPSGRERGRYLAESLPDLPFADREFDLALCSHFLFLYSDQVSIDSHRRSLTEMCRVARGVRVFPLLDLSAAESPHLRPLLAEFSAWGYDVSLRRVEFQRGGHTMLCLRRPDAPRKQSDA